MISRICLWLIPLSCLSATAHSADLLQWKLSTGDSLKYAVQNEMATTATVGGFDNKSRLLQTMHMGRNVWTTTARRNYVFS